MSIENYKPDHRNKQELSSIMKAVYSYIAQHPKTTNKGLYKKFPNINQNTLRTYKNNFQASSVNAEMLQEHLLWIYDLMNDKIRKGLPLEDNEKIRLKVIEKIIGKR